jgi:hypothetical protein
MPTTHTKSLGRITQRIADNCETFRNLGPDDTTSRGHIQDEITKDLKALVNLVGIDDLKTLAEKTIEENALIALLSEDEDEAKEQIKLMLHDERAALARAAKRLASLCESE